MFETSFVREAKRSPSFWLSGALCVIAVLFVLNVYRVNRPAKTTAARSKFVPQYTEGPIANERAGIEPGAYLSFRVNFNHRSTVVGSFRVVRSEPRIAFLILDEANFQKWNSNQEFVSAVSTGKVPAGQVTRVLEAGVYFLILDNRSSDKPAIVDFEFAAR